MTLLNGNLFFLLLNIVDEIDGLKKGVLLYS